MHLYSPSEESFVELSEGATERPRDSLNHVVPKAMHLSTDRAIERLDSKLLEVLTAMSETVEDVLHAGGKCTPLSMAERTECLAGPCLLDPRAGWLCKKNRETEAVHAFFFLRHFSQHLPRFLVVMSRW